MATKKIDRLVDALLDGPKTRDQLMQISGILTPVAFWQAIYRLGSVSQCELTIKDTKVRLFYLTSRPTFRRIQLSDYMGEILSLKRQGLSYKEIARKLNLPQAESAFEAAVRRYRKAKDLAKAA